MRRIAMINQKGGVGKTTTAVNLGAALAEQGRRVVLVDMDPQANLSMHLGVEVPTNQPTVYAVLHGGTTFAAAIRATDSRRLSVLPSNIDLSGADLELASVIGRDNLLSDAIEDWVLEYQKENEGSPADYVIFDCPPSLGLLSINALAAATEVIITVQTEFLALMGMSKLVEVVALIRRRLNPQLEITGIIPCLYDSRLRLAREVLGEVRKYFPGQVFRQAVRSNVKLAEAPSFATSIIEYAPDSNGALDYRRLALEVIDQEEGRPDMGHLPRARPLEELPAQRPAATADVPPSRVPAPAKPAVQPEEQPEEQPGAVEASNPSVDGAILEPQPPPRPAETPVESKTTEPRPAVPPPSGRDAVDEELRVLRSQDLPSLPPEAFELPRA